MEKLERKLKALMHKATDLKLLIYYYESGEGVGKTTKQDVIAMKSEQQNLIKKINKIKGDFKSTLEKKIKETEFELDNLKTLERKLYNEQRN